MYTINLFESSIYSSHLNNNSQITLDFDLRIFEDTIHFVNISLTDQHHSLLNIFDIQVSAKSSYTAIKKTVGQVQSSLWVFNKNSGQNKWDWIFDSNDISALEGVRSGDVGFEIEIKAIVQISENGNKMMPLIGKEHVRFSESDWISFTRHFGYSTKFGMSLPPSLLNDKSWIQAYELLEDAREHMQRGKTYDALRQCLSTIESYMDYGKDRSGPYSEKVWDELLLDITPQKKAGITGLLAGTSTYLNKIGHHRNSKQKDDGNLATIPLDQYEAELMMGISQLVVTYLEKLRTDC
ncbi:hypothetical protein SAMN03159341_13222 [Paenibacillus sp. 1_12]|uniref:hypothetical protein n=1 Tax=Paenibacillus sp. 1_12 TaxID=1566278 RepID=UPI0008F38406|nr:hypothetical protein [Paenibacillus sp. 1_12]SFM42120.1 hypothetical protein SAMN03159341_13222 [Paenibacillus sp. 1_12]